MSEATKQSSFLVAAKLDCFASLEITAKIETQINNQRKPSP
jgi:hypothetical protein